MDARLSSSREVSQSRTPTRASKARTCAARKKASGGENSNANGAAGTGLVYAQTLAKGVNGYPG